MIHNHSINSMRDELFDSLNVNALTRGQLDFDESSITVKKPRVIRRDDKSGQVLPFDPVRATQGKTFKCSSCPLPPHAFRQTRITRAVHMLDDSHSSFALFAYSDRCSWEHVEVVSKQLWQAFLDAQPKKLRAKKQAVLRRMVYLAMQNWKHQLTAEADLHKPKRIRELLSISEHQWRRDWLPFWRQMHDILTEHDTSMLERLHHATR